MTSSLKNGLFGPLFDRGDQSGSRTFPFVVLLIAVTLFASFCNLAIPEDSFFHVSTYTITLLGKYLCFAMLALAVDIIWGILRHLEPRAWRLLCLGWVCNGYVSDASDW